MLARVRRCCERSVFDETGPLDSSLPRLEDWDWLLRYTRIQQLGFLAKPLTYVNIGSTPDPNAILVAIERIKAKHLTELPVRDRRNFGAALEMERAAAHFRRGATMSAVPALLRSIWLAPLRNRALGAVLYNRFSRN